MHSLKRAIVVALVTAGAVFPATSAARVNAAPRHQCTRTFTLPDFERAAIRTYAGIGLPPRGSYAHLWRYLRCQRNPDNRPRARAFWRSQQQAWSDRRHPFRQSLASWYSDGGATACGYHVTYGVANKSLPCGTKVQFRLYGRQITAVVDDRGPYVGAREWDLNQNTAAALGFSGVGTVWCRVL